MPIRGTLGNPRADVQRALTGLTELLDRFDALAFETCYEFPFHAGDIQFCNNYLVLHGRAAAQLR